MADNENLNTEAIEPVEVVHDLPVERSLLGATLGANAAEGEQEPDEEYETIPVKELLEVKLGRQGENDTQTVVIDCSAWLQQLPGCTLMIAATRPGEREIYLPEVTVSNGVVTWPILAQDTACAGTGRAEVRAMLNDKIKKSALFRTRIEPALEPGGSPDAPTPPNWVKLIIGSVEASQAAAEHAEELVDEATACAINAVRFDEDQGLTEAQKAIGRGNIDAASVAALEAQATATAQALAGKVAIDQGVAQAGKAMVVGQDGNITTGDVVQIDDTLQQAGQAADAAAVGVALAGKVAVQQGSANAGKALVVGQDGGVTLGEAGVPEAVKTTLLELLRHVAYTDIHGMDYLEALAAALDAEITPDYYYLWTIANGSLLNNGFSFVEGQDMGSETIVSDGLLIDMAEASTGTRSRTYANPDLIYSASRMEIAFEYSGVQLVVCVTDGTESGRISIVDGAMSVMIGSTNQTIDGVTVTQGVEHVVTVEHNNGTVITLDGTEVFASSEVATAYSSRTAIAAIYARTGDEHTAKMKRVKFWRL